MVNTFELFGLVTSSQNPSEQQVTFLYQKILLPTEFKFQARVIKKKKKKKFASLN